MSALRAEGLSVTTGTINHAALLQSLLPLAPDAVTSDFPHELDATLTTAERPALAA
jgi:hypothetical protein